MTAMNETGVQGADGAGGKFSAEPRLRPARAAETGVLAVVLLAFVLVVIRTAWLCDDAYITFRTVDNFVNGYGLRWNTAERVQGYTHPLWTLLVSSVYYLTDEMYLTSILLCAVLSVIAVLLFALGIAESRSLAILGVVTLSCSQAFVDYSTSGLENPLTYLCLAVFLAVYCQSEETTPKRLFLLSLVACLGTLNRSDTVLLYAPALSYILLQSRSVKAFLYIAAGFFPLVLWECFSLVYYGFLFPNTAYAKLNTGIDASEMALQGLWYFMDSFKTDPLTLLVILCGILIPLSSLDRRQAPIAVGVLLYLAYIVRIGGCFMSGRFLAAPVFCAVALLARSPIVKSKPPFLAALLVVLYVGFLSPNQPWLTAPTYGDDRDGLVDKHGITNERAFYFPGTGLMHPNRRSGFVPTHAWVDQGKSEREKAPMVSVHATIGFRGFYAGPEVHILDYYALTEPLLARLPAAYDPGWRIGHFMRVRPPGFFKTLPSGENMITDKDLASYYDQLRLITRGPLLDWDRWVAIWAMNTGKYDRLVDFKRYRYPNMAQLTLEEAMRPGEVTRIEKTGAEISLPAYSHAGNLHVVLDRHNPFEVTFADFDSVLAKQDVRDPVAKREGAVEYRAEVPRKAALSGYNRLRIFPFYKRGACDVVTIGLTEDPTPAVTRITSVSKGLSHSAPGFRSTRFPASTEGH